MVLKFIFSKKKERYYENAKMTDIGQNIFTQSVSLDLTWICFANNETFSHFSQHSISVGKEKIQNVTEYIKLFLNFYFQGHFHCCWIKFFWGNTWVTSGSGRERVFLPVYTTVPVVHSSASFCFLSLSPYSKCYVHFSYIWHWN